MRIKKYLIIICLSLTAAFLLASCGTQDIYGGYQEEAADENASGSPVFAAPPEDGAQSNGLPGRLGALELPPNIKMSGSLLAAAEAVTGLPDRRFEVTYNILTTKPFLFTVSQDENIINEARYLRTKMVETEFGVIIKSIQVEDEYLYLMMERAVNTGEPLAEMICLTYDKQFMLMANGLLMSVKKTPFIELDSFNPSMTEASSVGYNTYMLASDLTLDPDECYAIFYNKNIAERLGLSFANLADDGSWTWEALIGGAKAAASDIEIQTRNGYGISLAANNDTLAAAYAAMDQQLYSVPKYSRPQMAFDNAVLPDISWVFGELLRSSDVYLNAESNNGQDSLALFNGGQTLFYTGKLGTFRSIGEMADNFGILPMPKLYGSQQGYYTVEGGNPVAVSIPENHPDTEMCGIITQALAYASDGFLRYEYINDLLFYHARDYESIVSARIVLGGVRYDFAQIAASENAVSNAGMGLLGILANDQLSAFESVYQKRAEAAEKFIAGSLK